MLFQRRAVPSFEADAIKVPFGFTFTSYTAPLWPQNLEGRRDALKCQIVTEPSIDEEISCFLVEEGIDKWLTYIFGLKHTLVTWALWPLKDLLRTGSVGVALNLSIQTFLNFKFLSKSYKNI